MTKDEYQDFVLRYKGCGACFPMYHTLSRFEKMWFTAIQKDVAELEKENAELKGEADSVLDNWCKGNDPCPHLKKRDDQLAKAKELLKKVIGSFYYLCEINNFSTNYECLAEAEQFLSEVEK